MLTSTRLANQHSASSMHAPESSSTALQSNRIMKSILLPIQIQQLALSIPSWRHSRHEVPPGPTSTPTHAQTSAEKRPDERALETRNHLTIVHRRPLHVAPTDHRIDYYKLPYHHAKSTKQISTRQNHHTISGFSTIRNRSKAGATVMGIFKFYRGRGRDVQRLK